MLWDCSFSLSLSVSLPSCLNQFSRVASLDDETVLGNQQDLFPLFFIEDVVTMFLTLFSLLRGRLVDGYYEESVALSCTVLTVGFLLRPATYSIFRKSNAVMCTYLTFGSCYIYIFSWYLFVIFNVVNSC